MANPDSADPAEIERLRAEVARLKEELDAPAPARSGHTRWVRSTAVVVLLVIGFILTPVSIASIWLRNTVYNTDTYVQTVQPLASNPAVISAVSLQVTDAIFQQVDIEALLQQNLPPKLSFAAGPLAAQVESQTNNVVTRALETPQFQQLWGQINRTASQSLVAFLTADKPSAISVQNGQLVLDLEPVVANVKQQLVDSGFSLASKIPSISKSVVLPVANVQPLVQARSMANLMRTLSYVLPVLAIVCFALAVFLARDRRRAVIWVGALLALGALVSGFGLASGRQIFLSQRPGTVFDAATAAWMFDTLSRFLRNSNRVVFLVGALIAIVGAFSGPYPWAVKTRGIVSGAITQGGAKTGWDTGAFGAWFDQHRRGWLVGIGALFAIVVIAWNRPTPAVILWLFIAALVLVAVGLFIAATAPRPLPEGEGEPTETPQGAVSP